MKKIYGKILGIVMAVFLCSCGVTQPQRVQESVVKEKTVTPQPKATRNPEPTEEPYEVTERKNIEIEGRTYKYAAYARTVSGKIVLMSLKTDEDVLYIPSEIEGNPIVKLGWQHLNISEWSDQISISKLVWNLGKSKKHLKRIVIAEGIEELTRNCFAEVSADEVIIPQSMREIGLSAFFRSKVKRVVLKSSKVNLDADVFWDSKLEEIQFPDEFRGKMGNGCFRGSNLKSFRWPAYGKQEITDIETYVFQECKKLKQVIFPENQECIYIPEGAFWQCTKLRQLEFPASTKKVVYRETYYADNYKHGVSTLIFKGRDTQIEGGDIHGIVSIDHTPEHFISVSKIIAPQDSEAIRFAKKAVKISHLKDWEEDEATCENDLDFQKITKEDLVPVEYEIRN